MRPLGRYGTDVCLESAILTPNVGYWFLEKIQNDKVSIATSHAKSNSKQVSVVKLPESCFFEPLYILNSVFRLSHMYFSGYSTYQILYFGFDTCISQTIVHTKFFILTFAHVFFWL